MASLYEISDKLSALIEEAFDIEIPDEIAEKITTVGDAIEYLKNNN